MRKLHWRDESNFSKNSTHAAYLFMTSVSRPPTSLAWPWLFLSPSPHETLYISRLLRPFKPPVQEHITRDDIDGHVPAEF